DDLWGVGGEQRPGIVHRLDRGTTGLLVVAKHDRAHRHLADQFARHVAGRIYLALCHGGPSVDAGTIEGQLARHPRVRVRMTSVPSGGRRAVTHWRLLARAEAVSLLQCQLETGRTHQVRVHLSEQGWPLLGDGLYGRPGAKVPGLSRGLISAAGERPMLHAWQLGLTHPTTGARLRFVAPIPDDLSAALSALGIVPPQPDAALGIVPPQPDAALG
ncbi:MAG TPA: RluA family pseudouridine synthase, partial [Deltaproteobacteria bacterium]|nr:RluA family pseudouridine synthase [Deltaproteobacteria bacterium]